MGMGAAGSTDRRSEAGEGSRLWRGGVRGGYAGFGRRILELLVGGDSGAVRRERWGGVSVEAVGELGPPPPSLFSPLPECRRRRPDHPHPLLNFL
jgi:hypothetical protein